MALTNDIDWSKLSEVELLKHNSNYLRGTLEESLADELTGALAPDDRQLSKFHGMYQQFDRDTEADRLKAKLEPDFSFLIRVRVPGGVVNGKQWLQMDAISDQYANSTLKLTTRQAFQFHGVFKHNLKSSIKAINDALLDTIAACGDVNRNVMVSANPAQSAAYGQVLADAKAVNTHLTPQTPAYFEIWLGQDKVASGMNGEEIEPIYGDRYLPRKFKIGFTIPPYNDIDVYTQDLGFIAIVENGELQGYNVTVGGGFGTTFGNSATYPRLGNTIGFCPKNDVVNVAEKVMLVQKDNGNRFDRKNSRFKYTVDRLGLEGITTELAARGVVLAEPKPYVLKRNGDEYGWLKDSKGKWYLTLFIEGGRIKNHEQARMKDALAQIAKIGEVEFRLTGNQNLIAGNFTDAEVKKVNKILASHHVSPFEISGLRKNSIACVALNTCSLAFAEAERYIPTLITKIDTILVETGLFDKEIVIRMTGCPNGCGRPYNAEIGLIGKAPGRYNLYLGGNIVGSRLNTLFRENIDEQRILAELKVLLIQYAAERTENEDFGDFVIRKGIVTETKEGKDFRH